jgi:hypothetical protein
MHTTFSRIALLAALAAAAVGCDQQAPSSTGAAPAAAVTVTPGTPDGTITASVKALRDNNLAALLENTLPPGELTKVKADWGKSTQEPITDEDRKQFTDTMTKLTAADAEAKLYAQIEPQLKEFDQKSAQQMPMMVAMGQGFAQSAIQQNKDLNDQQKQQAQVLLDSVAKWAQATHFTDPALVKSAIAIVCKAARDLNLKSIDEARALTYDQAMQKAGVVLGATKQVLGVYGLNVDKALDSIKVEPVTTAGDTAKVKVTYTAFDQTFSTDNDLVRVSGKWYSKQAIDQWNKHQQEIAGNAAPAEANKPEAAPSAK